MVEALAETAALSRYPLGLKAVLSATIKFLNPV